MEIAITGVAENRTYVNKRRRGRVYEGKFNGHNRIIVNLSILNAMELERC